MELYETLYYVLLALAFGTSITFFVGRRFNHKLVNAIYMSAWNFLEDHCPSDTANFKKSWYGTITGTFPLKEEEPIKAMEVSISLLSRDLGIQYPLSKIIKKIDRLYFLAYLNDTPRFDMVLISWNAHRLGSIIKNLSPVNLDDESLGRRFKLYASNPDEAIQFLNKRLLPKLQPLKGSLKELMLSRERSAVYALCEAKPEFVQHMLETVFALALFSTKSTRKKYK